MVIKTSKLKEGGFTNGHIILKNQVTTDIGEVTTLEALLLLIYINKW